MDYTYQNPRRLTRSQAFAGFPQVLEVQIRDLAPNISISVQNAPARQCCEVSSHLVHSDVETSLQGQARLRDIPTPKREHAGNSSSKFLGPNQSTPIFSYILTARMMKRTSCTWRSPEQLLYQPAGAVSLSCVLLQS
jgi:hypothetical protein